MDHRHPVGDFEQLVEVLADHEDRAALARPDRRAPDGSVARRPHPRPRSAGRRRAAWAARIISRPMTNFCRLPPESFRACGSGSGVRTSKLWMIGARQLSRGIERDEARAAHLAGAVWEMSVFSLNRCVGAAAWPRRSSGTKAAPQPSPRFDAERPAGPAVDRDGVRGGRQGARPTAPRTVRSGRCRRRLRCRRPRPPAHSQIDARDSAMAWRLAGEGQAGRPAASSLGPMCGRGAARPRRLRCRPSCAAISRALRSRGSMVATTRPARRMVARPHRRRTSSSLWEM